MVMGSFQTASPQHHHYELIRSSLLHHQIISHVIYLYQLPLGFFNFGIQCFGVLVSSVSPYLMMMFLGLEWFRKKLSGYYFWAKLNLGEFQIFPMFFMTGTIAKSFYKRCGINKAPTPNMGRPPLLWRGDYPQLVLLPSLTRFIIVCKRWFQSSLSRQNFCI